MKVEEFNSEGYHDPVPYEAIRRVDAKRYHPIVYICSPFSGDTEGNAIRARNYSRFAVDRGAIPIAPHLLFPQFLSEETERDLAMFMDLIILCRCEQLWAFGEATAGMKREIEKAVKKDIMIRYFTEELEEKII